MAKSIRIPLAGLALTTLALAAAAQSSNAQAAQTRDYHIESQPLPAAVNDWADQAGLQVMWSARMPGAQREAPEVAGRFSAPVALERVLQGSGLTFAFLDEKTVAIRLASAAAQSSPSQATGKGGEQAMTRSAEGAGRGEGRGEDLTQSVRGVDAAAASKEETISEVVVTGTHIRGHAPVGSALLVYDRSDIEQSGAGSVEQLLRQIPQNFASTDGETFLVRNQGSNSARGSGVDLRGLGAGATLVLLNGHRLAPAGDGGTFVDVSMIPLSAIERVEILTDGASAIYGADAVSGVANFVLRKDFSGAETSLRYADTTHGGAKEYAASQAFGGAWQSGRGMLVLEHSVQQPLFADQRDFIPPQPNQTRRLGILPEQKRDSVFASGTQNLTSRVEAFGDAFLSRRDYAQDFFRSDGQFAHDQGEATTYDAVAGVNVDAWRGWRATLFGNYSRHEEDNRTTTAAFDQKTAVNSDIYSVDGRLEGPVLTTAAGAVRLVTGVSVRREQFELATAAGFDQRRDVSSLFGELFVPLLRTRSDAVAGDRLTLSLAARYDDYTDVGSSIDPKIGLSWVPLTGLTLRGSYGTSFRAAPLSQLTAANPNYFVFPLPDAAGTDGSTTTLFLSSPGNPALGPETSQSVTAGFDLRPPSLQGLSFAATYFNIRYRDRIAAPPVVGSTFLIYSQTATLAPFINRSPTAAQIAAIYGSNTVTDFLGAGGPNGAGVEAIFDFRLQNIAEVDTSGLDLTADYTIDTSSGSWHLFINANYLFESDSKPASTTQTAELLNTTYNPMDLRLRGGLGWTGGDFSSSLMLNYADDYQNNLQVPVGSVDSWTTADLTFTYGPENVSSPLLQGFRFALNVQNITDQDPPRIPVIPVLNPLGYDMTNAQVRGRTIALAVTKSW